MVRVRVVSSFFRLHGRCVWQVQYFGKPCIRHSCLFYEINQSLSLLCTFSDLVTLCGRRSEHCICRFHGRSALDFDLHTLSLAFLWVLPSLCSIFCAIEKCTRQSPDTPCMPYMPTLGWFGGSMGRHMTVPLVLPGK